MQDDRAGDEGEPAEAMGAQSASIQAVVLLGPMKVSPEDDAGGGSQDDGGDAAAGADMHRLPDDESVLRKICVDEDAVRTLQEALSGVRFDLENWIRKHRRGHGEGDDSGADQGEGAFTPEDLPEQIQESYMDCICTVGELLGAYSPGGVQGSRGAERASSAASSTSDLALAEASKDRRRRELRIARAMLSDPPPASLNVVKGLEQLFNVNMGFNATHSILCAWFRRLLGQ